MRFCQTFQPLCSLTPVQLYILPARLTYANTDTHWHKSRRMGHSIIHAGPRAGNTYLRPHTARKQLFFFLCPFNEVCPGRLLDTRPFVCDVSVRGYSGATSQPYRVPFLRVHLLGDCGRETTEQIPFKHKTVQ